MTLYTQQEWLWRQNLCLISPVLSRVYCGPALRAPPHPTLIQPVWLIKKKRACRGKQHTLIGIISKIEKIICSFFTVGGNFKMPRDILWKLLIDYCSLQNRKGTIPHFLILDSPDFEYAACLHDPNYKNQDTERYIRTVFGFQSLEAFKKYEKIYEFLNSDGRSYKDMIEKTRVGECIIRQRYTISKKRFEVRIVQTHYDPEKYWTRGSNIFEFFDVIDW